MARPQDQRIATIPNVLSLIRLLCVPLFIWLLFGRHERYHAALLLAALGTTDWIDGYVARHFHQESNLGKILDPTADRLLLFTGVLGILIDGSVPVWVAVATIAREGLVSIAAVTLAVAGARRMDVQWVGKAGTFGLLVAFPLFLASHSTVGWHHTAGSLAWICAVPGLLFSYYAAITYVPLARQALADGRAERRVGSKP
jgi:cardiolipin synthase (CMP-forming)